MLVDSVAFAPNVNPPDGVLPNVMGADGLLLAGELNAVDPNCPKEVDDSLDFGVEPKSTDSVGFSAILGTDSTDFGAPNTNGAGDSDAGGAAKAFVTGVALPNTKSDFLGVVFSDVVTSVVLAVTVVGTPNVNAAVVADDAAGAPNVKFDVVLGATVVADDALGTPNVNLFALVVFSKS